MKTGKRVYRFEPVGWDHFAPHAGTPDAGTLVPKCQPFGTPANGTMGHAFVCDDASGEFLGLVLLASLVPAGKRAAS